MVPFYRTLNTRWWHFIGCRTRDSSIL